MAASSRPPNREARKNQGYRPETAQQNPVPPATLQKKKKKRRRKKRKERYTNAFDSLRQTPPSHCSVLAIAVGGVPLHLFLLRRADETDRNMIHVRARSTCFRLTLPCVPCVFRHCVTCACEKCSTRKGQTTRSALVVAQTAEWRLVDASQRALSTFREF